MRGGAGKRGSAQPDPVCVAGRGETGRPPGGAAGAAQAATAQHQVTPPPETGTGRAAAGGVWREVDPPSFPLPRGRALWPRVTVKSCFLILRVPCLLSPGSWGCRPPKAPPQSGLARRGTPSSLPALPPWLRSSIPAWPWLGTGTHARPHPPPPPGRSPEPPPHPPGAQTQGGGAGGGQRTGLPEAPASLLLAVWTRCPGLSVGPWPLARSLLLFARWGTHCCGVAAAAMAGEPLPHHQGPWGLGSCWCESQKSHPQARPAGSVAEY